MQATLFNDILEYNNILDNIYKTQFRKRLKKKYHPDNKDTGDSKSFILLQEYLLQQKSLVDIEQELKIKKFTSVNDNTQKYSDEIIEEKGLFNNVIINKNYNIPLSLLILYLLGFQTILGAVFLFVYFAMYKVYNLYNITFVIFALSILYIILK